MNMHVVCSLYCIRRSVNKYIVVREAFQTKKQGNFGPGPNRRRVVGVGGEVFKKSKKSKFQVSDPEK